MAEIGLCSLQQRYYCPIPVSAHENLCHDEPLLWIGVSRDEFAIVQTRRFCVDIQHRTSSLLHYLVCCFLIFVPNAIELTSPIQCLVCCVSENQSLSFTLPFTLLDPMITSLPFNTSLISDLLLRGDLSEGGNHL